MGILDALFGRKTSGGGGEPAAAGPKFVSKDRKGDSTYEVYKGTDAESARAFLLGRRVDKPQYYVIVETPEGNWGMDVEGLFLENLLAWQKDTSRAECDGRVAKIPATFALAGAARGVNDNFVVEIACGKCEHVWPDGLRYQNTTAVRCPKCRAVNKIDTSNFTVV